MNKCRKKDIILIIILLSIGFLGIVLVKHTGTKGSTVNVYIDNDLKYTYSLNHNGKYKIKTDDGYNVICIKNHKVSIMESSCKNQNCVKHSAISKSNESIICLPHKLVIRISGNDTGKLDDIVK